MTKATTKTRWREAQNAELRFWRGTTFGQLLQICAAMRSFTDSLGDSRLSALFDGKAVLEIGCGPLGLSIASFYEKKATIRRLVKTDPLPQIHLSETPAAAIGWARPFVAWVDSLAHEGEYIQQAGEELGFDRAFDTVVTYNVIDHVQDPARVLSSGHAALKSGGTMMVAVDCLSLCGRLKFEHYIRRRLKGSILVEAHPHSFLPGHVERLLRATGFTNVECLAPRRIRHQLFGRSFRPTFLACRP